MPAGQGSVWINIYLWSVFWGQRCQTEILVANAIRCESPIRLFFLLSKHFSDIFVRLCFMNTPVQKGEKKRHYLTIPSTCHSQLQLLYQNFYGYKKIGS